MQATERDSRERVKDNNQSHNSHNSHNDKLETLESLFQISQLLNCDIDRSSLALCISLCEQGVNPEALSVLSLLSYSLILILLFIIF